MQIPKFPYLTLCPRPVVSTVEEAADRSYAFIVVAIKCLPDVKPTSSILEPILRTISSSPETSIVLLQNGVGIEEDLHDALTKLGASSPVLSGCAWVDATAVDGGKRVVQHGSERLVIGFHPRSELSVRSAEQALSNFCELLIAGGVSAEPVPDINVARWQKVLWYGTISEHKLYHMANIDSGMHRSPPFVP